ncbi:sugar transferase [Reinekea sp.]|jgi:lipopolysaccharide/colanic/teichoic acid biosynthesis glycosyltransferase|uniref:sugar transferase n=1 Tax=Reinekea sp. TaxID=1970455 RepID=UPI002A7FDFCE|nr:sugar transferase [Reinekea sp.]
MSTQNSAELYNSTLSTPKPISLLPLGTQYLPKKLTCLPTAIQRLAAAIGLLLILPLLFLVGLALRWESKGSVIYSQVRVGKRGRRFTLYKFRSMYLPTDPKYIDPSQLHSDRAGACKKLFKDPRITALGRILRKLSIDELPQLWNVVKGDMLLIGPRPALTEEVAVYSSLAMDRLQVVPGLTGLWQVSGRADTSFDEQIALDLRYIREQSLTLDLKILIYTLPAVVFGKGAY